MIKVFNADVSILECVLTNNTDENEIYTQVRETLKTALNDKSIQIRLSAINTLRALEDTHIKRVANNERYKMKTVDLGDVISIDYVEDRIRKLEKGDTNGTRNTKPRNRE